MLQAIPESLKLIMVIRKEKEIIKYELFIEKRRLISTYSHTQVVAAYLSLHYIFDVQYAAKKTWAAFEYMLGKPTDNLPKGVNSFITKYKLQIE